MRAEDVAARYTQPGKVAVRKFVVDLAVASGCKTALDFWGGGTSAREFTAAGLSVVSAELDRSLWSELDRDAADIGYVAHHGRASKVDGVFDMVWADFCGMVSGEMERELGGLARHADKFLIVTLMPERESVDEGDRFFVRWRPATIPAWLIVVTGLGLDYITRYIRNDSNQEMWLAVLSRRKIDPQLNPMTIARNLQYVHRRHWASMEFRRRYPDLVPRTNNLRSGGVAKAKRCEACREWWVPRMNCHWAKYCSKVECKRERDRRISQAAREAKRIPHEQRTCLYCGVIFRPRRGDQKCCTSQHNANYNSREWYRTRSAGIQKRRHELRESQPKPALPIAA